MSEETGKIKVGISIGDSNGIGLEVIMKTLADSLLLEDIIPIVYGGAEVTKEHRKTLDLEDFAFHGIQSAAMALPRKANLIHVIDEKTEVKFGEPTKASALAALKSLESAVSDLASNKVDVLITAPIDKANMQKAGFAFPGHTEYLAKMANVDEHLMLLVNGSLRLGVVTGHIPLKDVPATLSKELIGKKLRLLADSLRRDFGIRKPKIAVLGLNPHAGDNGALGSEEKEVILPAIRDFKEEGALVFGPYAADGFFGSDSFRKFDGILAMYHDQGLAPFKALGFEEGVNFTAGLPIVRTSPDHGTAFDIAGKNVASPSSFRHAIYVACDVYRNRREFREITANPLPFRKVEREREH
jgi:4-hydroxythreonine-4-phosphate dehydrogenase